MEGYWLMGEYGKARHEDFLQEANRARRFLSAKKPSRLPTLVKSLLLLFG